MKKLFLLIACFGMVTFKAQNPGVSTQDKEFAEFAMMSNLAELKFSQMAVNKGFSPEVKELATHMVEDNKKADVLLRQLATERSITLVTNLNAELQKDLNELSDKVGEAFDKAYAEYMVKLHKKATDLYEKEIKKGENTELRAFATNVQTSVIHHKNLADETCKKLKKK